MVKNEGNRGEAIATVATTVGVVLFCHQPVGLSLCARILQSTADLMGSAIRAEMCRNGLEDWTMMDDNMIGMEVASMNVPSRRSDSRNISLSWLRIAVSRFIMAFAFGLVFSIRSQAATLSFDVTVLQGDAADSLSNSRKGTEPREVMFLVIDHSGSMNETDNRLNSRWEALLDSLKLTLSSLRPGTEVRVEWIESLWKTNRHGRAISRLPNRQSIKPIILSDSDSWKSVWSSVEVIGKPGRNTGTPLFETLEKVSDAASNLVQKGVRVAVVVFSDGDSTEGTDDEKRVRRERIGKEYRRLFEDTRFKACLVWINPKEAPPPESLMGAKWNLGYQAPPAIYSSKVEPSLVVVENPLSGGQKPGLLSLAFFVTKDVWKEMEGKPAQLSVMRRIEGGAVVPVGETTVSIRRGVQPCRIEVPDGLLGASAQSSLLLEFSNIPSPKGALVSPPQSVSLLVVEPDKLSISSVTPTEGTIVREGDEIEFSVSATPGANCEWSFGDGSPFDNRPITTHSYAHADTYEVKVVVRKDGFAPREGLVETRKIEVVHADVVLEPIAKQVQGRESKFSCKGTGPVSGYVWIVDGEEVSGIDSADKKSSTLSYSFQSAGAHTIQARADMTRIGSVLSEKKTFDVGVAPYLRIDKPDAGTAFVAGEQIPFHAKVDGGVSNVRWSVVDSSGTEVWSVPGVADGGESKSVATLNKPGEYTASVVDAAGIAAKSEVVFSVRPKDVSLVVSEPADGSRIETGVNKTIDLRVSAKGIDKVLWFVRNDETGDETALGESQVDAQGYATKAWPVPPANGMGTRVVFARDAASDFESAPVRVELYTVGDVKIIYPPDYFPVPFGTNVTLRAEMSGAATDVHWFVDGEELKCRGESVSFDVGRAKAPKRLFRVQARASMPGGGVLVTPERTVVAYCPKVQLAVKALPGKQGSVTSYGLNENIGFSLVNLDGGEVGEPLSDIEWSFGDGTVLKGQDSHLDHAYTNYYTSGVDISASCKCALCGDPAEVKPYRLKVEKQPPKAVIDIREKGSHYGTGDTIHLSAEKSSGDIVDYIWEIDGKEQAEDRGKQEIKVKLPKKPCEMIVKLTLTGLDGATSEAQRDVRVRWGAVVIVLLLLVVALAVGVLARLLWGNGPAGWIAILYCCEPIDHSTDKGKEKERGKLPQEGGAAESIPLRKHWNYWDKTAAIPLEKISSATDLEKLSTFIDDNCRGEAIVVCPRPDGDKYRDFVNLNLSEVSDGFDAGINYMFYQYKGGKATSQKPNLLRVVIDRSKNSHRYEVYFMALTLLVLAAAFWAALKYAI